MNVRHTFALHGGFMLRKTIVLFSLLLNFQIVLADDALQLEKKIDAILDRSGIDKQTMQLKETMSAQVKEGVARNKKLSPEQIEKLSTIAMEEFKPQEILSRIKNRLKNWSAKEINELHSFYEQDSVKKFARLEEEGTSAAAQSAMIDYVKNLEKNPPEKERLGLIFNFMNDSKAVEVTVQIVADTVVGMGMAFGENVPESVLEQLKQQMTPVLQQQILLSSLFTYRDVPTNELKDYFSKYHTDNNLKKIIKEVMDEYHKGFSEWGLNFGLRIKKEFPRAEKK